jgi:5-formyltetrahydrofolate cyclo-ligase
MIYTPLGLVFKFQVLDQIPYENHDQKIDGFVSQTGLHLI